MTAQTGPGDEAPVNTADQPVGRVRFMDAQRVNLDGFAKEEPGLGLIALRSPHDPEPGIRITGGRVVELDGVTEDNFDAIDALIARHGLDTGGAAAPAALIQGSGEASGPATATMGLTHGGSARRLVSPDVPRAEIVRLSA